MICLDISVAHLSKQYGAQKVLDDFSCCFPEGKISCIMGASGCGKTTLLHILMGLIPADSGKIEGLSGKQKSAVFQENRLCGNLSASVNIQLACKRKLSHTDLENAMAAVGLPNDETKAVQALSGGMQRRVAILRALFADYDILFLDEPFKGLDTETRRMVISYFREQTYGKSVLMVTHDPEEPELVGASSVLHMKEY